MTRRKLSRLYIDKDLAALSSDPVAFVAAEIAAMKHASRPLTPTQQAKLLLEDWKRAIREANGGKELDDRPCCGWMGDE